MVALTRDSDGDGVIDMYGYDSRWDFLVYNLTMKVMVPMSQEATKKTFPLLRLPNA